VLSIPAGAAFDVVNHPSVASTAIDNVVRFDEVRPTVTVEKGASQADPTNAAPIVFDVVFSEDVTGFGDSPSDVDLSASTFGVPLSAAVSGSGSTYTVTVTGMAGEGDIVLKVPSNAAQDLAGNFSLASTSVDNRVRFDIVSPSVTVKQAATQD